MFRIALQCLAAAAVLAVAWAGPATATFPGTDGRIAFMSDRDGDQEIWVMDANGANPLQLTSDPALDQAPVVSPDGTKVAFESSRTGFYDIYVANIDGSGTAQQITTGPNIEGLPSWSPDGTRLAYQTDSAGGFEIFTTNADGSGSPVNVTQNVAADHAPSFSPDGTKIAFQSNRDGNDEIYVANADGSGTPLRITTDSAADQSVNWSPDGTRLAWMSTRDGGDMDIFTANADGSGTPAQITTNNAISDEVPVFSPDGQTIVFARNEGGDDEVVVTPVGGGAITPLTANGSSDREPDWQRSAATPAVSISDTSIMEGTGGQQSAIHSVTIAPPAAAGTSVSFATEPGTASAPGDFATTSGQLTFTAGQQEAFVTVPIAGDDADEPDESYTIDLLSPSGVVIGDGEATGTILDDDSPAPPPADPFGPAPFALAGALIAPNGLPGGNDEPTADPEAPRSPRAPTVRIEPDPRSPRAGRKVVLSAARSRDADGKVTAVEWDLDGDGVHDDATGTRVTTTFLTPGRIRVGASVRDDGGRVATGTATVRVRTSDAAELEPVGELVDDQNRARPGQLTFAKGYAGWDRTGTAFGSRPARGETIPADRVLDVKGAIGGDYTEVGVPSGASGSTYASSFRPRTLKGVSETPAGNLATGRLASPRIPLTKSEVVSFQLGGEGDGKAGRASKTRVDLYAAKGSRDPVLRPELSTAVPAGGSALTDVELDVGALIDAGYTTAVLVAVDDSSAGHILLDGVGTKPVPVAVGPAPAAVNEVFVPDRGPLTGFADAHAHPMAHQGFGGLRGVRTYMGVPGGALGDYTFDPGGYKRDVGRDHKGHFGGATAAFFLDVLEGRKNVPGGLIDVVGGLATAGHGGGKPGPAHQMMHITDVHRAYQGGLRLMSSLAVTNVGAETLTAKVHDQLDVATPHSSDQEVIEAHVRAMRDLAAKNSTWMQIVYDPAGAHQVIRNGKLAIVLGTEVDSIGRLANFPSAEAEVDYLWRLGIRQVTPIHAVDNELGGAGVFQNGYNTLQDWLRRPAGRGSSLASVSNSLGTYGNTNPSQGLLVDQRRFPGSATNALYGDLMDVERYGCLPLSANDGPRPPRGECIDFRYAAKQNIFTQTGIGGLNLIFPHDVTPQAYQAGNEPGAGRGHRNQLGLTDYGRSYIRALMRRGMLIDIEHGSDRAFDALVNGAGDGSRGPVWDALPAGRPGCKLDAGIDARALDRVCWTNAYPLMSSHTSFRGMSLTDQTDIEDWRPSEFERTPRQVEYIRLSGGIVAPFLNQDPAETPTVTGEGAQGPPDWRITPADDVRFDPRAVANSCAGTSRGWMQAFLYAAAKMQADPLRGGERAGGVAISSDFPLIGGPDARFATPGDPKAIGCTKARAADSVPGSSRVQEEQKNPGLWRRDLQSPGSKVRYVTPGQSRPDGFLEGQIHPGSPITASSIVDVNTHGVENYGLIPDFIQDARMVGMSDLAVRALLNSADRYVHMWDRAFAVSGCVGAQVSRCRGQLNAAGVPLDLIQLSPAVCRNTCPNSPGRGMDLDPNGVAFPFEP